MSHHLVTPAASFLFFILQKNFWTAAVSFYQVLNLVFFYHPFLFSITLFLICFSFLIILFDILFYLFYFNKFFSIVLFCSASLSFLFVFPSPSFFLIFFFHHSFWQQQFPFFLLLFSFRIALVFFCRLTANDSFSFFFSYCPFFSSFFWQQQFPFFLFLFLFCFSGSWQTIPLPSSLFLSKRMMKKKDKTKTFFPFSFPCCFFLFLFLFLAGSWQTIPLPSSRPWRRGSCN